MTIQTIDTVTPEIGLKGAGEKINANFTNAAHAASYEVGTDSGQIPRNSDLGTAAQADTGTGADQVPTNGDLGTASTKDTGTATGQIPTSDQLSMVGETVNYTGANYQPEIADGLNNHRLMSNQSGGTHNNGQTGIAGSTLRHIVIGSNGAINLRDPATGTWTCVSGGVVSNIQTAHYVRTA